MARITSVRGAVALAEGSGLAFASVLTATPFSLPLFLPFAFDGGKVGAPVDVVAGAARREGCELGVAGEVVDGFSAATETLAEVVVIDADFAESGLVDSILADSVFAGSSLANSSFADAAFAADVLAAAVFGP